MTYSDGEALLRRRIGLDANSIGAASIARAIEQRMADGKITEIASYLEKVQESTAEWEALIDSVIVPETWFFRERESFNFLQKYIQSEWLINQSKRVLRILSVPCSTGEEPYSIAIALLETGLNPANFHIDAIDISKKCLLTAQRAIYDKYSFRGNSLSFQERYFQPTEGRYRLCEQVRNLVHFRQGNLADIDFLLGAASYDVVFCRNLLIYFEPSTKERTIRTLERLLIQDGLLFVGHAETGLLLNSRFTLVPHSLAFAYRKTNVSRSVAKSSPGDRKKHHPISPKPRIAHHRKPQQPQISQQNFLDAARTLADQGSLQQACQFCQDYLQQNLASVEGYVLLGQLQQAMGENEQAVASFQKAIYLQPNHEEALIHLALLREHQGDMVNAELLWQRIHRLHNQ
ncbi:MCP methyltransferase, CheR-type with Tpr repeats [Tolypothrix tenuis PCC 7101]|uniref:MCP methyltransferase, CheR-type with Tpr repeats n=1 Tax=Tolypothrix tenuis PCC 7101 TaxID=231146 RepID=A0A1Z4MX27_9CYAN|nr:methyltransferase domain-containing protein [Aulosira sp. FACHB-113]BAY98000.1 MCP methyltransferase, CheR-type with Tpr repeats [Tolypothrix tenuis PCC 7101]BAZ71493.1 MCP methyltransferase, CheR-type with Tpr repeats [Aulosira laxa NIES-50]